MFEPVLVTSSLVLIFYQVKFLLKYKVLFVVLLIFPQYAFREVGRLWTCYSSLALYLRA